MVNKRMWIGAGLLAVLAVFAIYRFVTREERAVKKRFAVLSQWVSKEPGEAPLEKVGKARAAAGIFRDPCRFEIASYEISAEVSLQQLEVIALQGRDRFRELSLEFYDLSVEFPEAGQAAATATARLTGKKSDGGGVNETHEITAALAKGDEGWRFTRISAVEVLQK